MLRRIAVFILLATLAFTVACTNKKVNNPLANVGSKQPDKVLFDRAMDAMKHNRFDVARITLQTLINTYPDRSEEHTSELQSLRHLVCRLLLEKKKKKKMIQLILHQSHISSNNTATTTT